MASKPANAEKLRIVVVGKARKGKNVLINTILGKESTAEYSGSECKVIKGEFEKEPVVFIDTPGLLCTDLTDEKLKVELTKCILHAAPGPHVFLYVNTEPFTSEEERAVKILEGIFKNSESYFLGVLMRNEVISAEDHHEIQKSFVGKFSEYVIVNKDKPNVSELMKKIKGMAEKQGHYTNELCEEAEKLTKSGGTVEDITDKIICGLTNEVFFGLLKKGIEYLAKVGDKAIGYLS